MVQGGNPLYPVLSIGLGVLISVMIALNSRLAAAMGNIPASIIIHIVGLTFISLIIPLRPRFSGSRNVPYILRLGGVVGIAVTLLNNLCFLQIGASLTIGLGILGQTLAGQAVDLTGFLGMEKHPFKKAKLIGWALILAGAFTMTGGQWGRLSIMILALIAGAFVMLSSVLNARLANGIGIFRATRNNFIMGLAGLTLLFLMNKPSLEPFTGIPEISPVYLAGGGLLAVLVVMVMNIVLPKIPTVYSTILIFSGQISAGMCIDFLLTGSVSRSQGLGAFIILTGLGMKTLVDRHSRLRDAGSGLKA